MNTEDVAKFSVGIIGDFVDFFHYNAGQEHREYQPKSAIKSLDWKEGQALVGSYLDSERLEKLQGILHPQDPMSFEHERIQRLPTAADSCNVVGKWGNCVIH
jgi:hypothetical protein